MIEYEYFLYVVQCRSWFYDSPVKSLPHLHSKSNLIILTKNTRSQFLKSLRNVEINVKYMYFSTGKCLFQRSCVLHFQSSGESTSMQNGTASSSIETRWRYFHLMCLCEDLYIFNPYSYDFPILSDDLK